MILVRHATLVTPTRHAEDAAMLVSGRRIAATGHDAVLHAPAEAQIIDAHGLLLVPGFIDLQLNGAFGSDFTADPASIWPVSAQLPRFGITSYLPTIVTSPLATVEQARLEIMREHPAAFRGAQPLGLHVEGPFLNPLKKGAHNPAYLQLPDRTAVSDWSAENGIRLVTLAPELPGALGLIEDLATRGVVVSLGHSMAAYDEALAGFAAGAHYATHLFNAMSAMGHREPGLPAAALTSPDVVVGLIVDGIHVHPAVLRLIWAVKGAEGVNLVSDAISALGMPPGAYILNDFEVAVSETDCRLADGTLAGSVLAPAQALRNLIAITGCGLPEALATWTTTPATLLGIAAERGDLKKGMIADFALLTADLEVHTTVAAGEIVYSREFDRQKPANQN